MLYKILSFFQFQKIHRALRAIEIGTKLDPDQVVYEDEDSDQNTESTAQV